MYSIILDNGKIINVNATTVNEEWIGKDKVLRFLDSDNDLGIITVARFNMDYIVGWAKTDHIVGNDPYDKNAEEEEND